MPNLILRLALPSPLRRLFDYLAPAGVSRSTLQPGVRLREPFGRREMIGVLVEVDTQSDIALDKLKPALELLDARPPLPARPCCQLSVLGVPAARGGTAPPPPRGAMSRQLQLGRRLRQGRERCAAAAAPPHLRWRGPGRW